MKWYHSSVQLLWPLLLYPPVSPHSLRRGLQTSHCFHLGNFGSSLSCDDWTWNAPLPCRPQNQIKTENPAITFIKVISINALDSKGHSKISFARFSGAKLGICITKLAIGHNHWTAWLTEVLMLPRLFFILDLRSPSVTTIETECYLCSCFLRQSTRHRTIMCGM